MIGKLRLAGILFLPAFAAAFWLDHPAYATLFLYAAIICFGTVLAIYLYKGYIKPYLQAPKD